MITALVTGGAGFIGSALAKRLHGLGWKVDIVDDMSNGRLENISPLSLRNVHTSFLHIYQEKFESLRVDTDVLVISGDFAHKLVLERIKASRYDYIFHVAARPRVELSVMQPLETFEDNVFKTLALFNAARSHVKRIVFSSSSSVYGDPEIYPTPETVVKAPCSPYAQQKCDVENYSRLWRDLYRTDIVSLRYFNVYGPGCYGDSPYSTAVAAWCQALSNGTPLRKDGDGDQSRDLTYIDDVVESNVLAALCKNEVAGEYFNVSGGNCISNNQILDMLREKVGRFKLILAPTRVGDVRKTQADLEKSNKLLGYVPKMSFENGLDKTLRWWGLKD